MNDNPNYKMIELARNSRGITQKQLESLLPKINQPNISKIERGVLPFTEEYVSILSKALDYPEKFFYQAESKIPVSSLYFRKRATIPQKVLHKITSDICIILKGIDTLLQDIELREYPKFCFDISEGWTPESVAVRIKEIMEIDAKRPIKNIITKIEELGVLVFLYDSKTEKFDGTTCYTDNGTPIIFVNKNVSNDRLKRTIVHEFFHLVMHIPCNVEPWRETEVEADKATNEFFMPKDICINEFNGISFNDLGTLKSYWGVSKASIIRRAKELDLINANTYQYWNIELGRRGERKVEKGTVDIDSPKILPTVMKLLKDQFNYTNEDLAIKCVFL